MFSDKILARAAGLAMVAGAVALPSVASAGVVVKSTGPSASNYPVGRQVADSATITLRAGDKITVLTDSGTSVMQGPGTFRVGEGATRTRARFSNLSRRSASSRARTGATRTGPGEEETEVLEAPQSPPSLWFVNLANEGTVCLYDLNRVEFWRPGGEAVTYTIRDVETQDAFTVNFVETEAIRAWDPSALPLMTGREYMITGPGEASEGEDTPPAAVTTTINFATLEGTFRQQDELAAALIANGCTAQLTQLADELEAYAETRAN